MIRSAGAHGGLLALLILLLLPGLALAQPKFPPLTGRVVDGANLLSPEAEQRITAESEALEAKTGHQFVVATVPSLQGYEIEDFGYRLGRTWGLGRKEQDDGVILLVAPNERKVRIEVGYGLEPVLTDALTSVILQTAVLPQFKQGNYEAGVLAGSGEIVRQLGLPPETAQANAQRAEQALAQRRDPDAGSALPAIVVMFVIFFVLSRVLGAFGGRRRHSGMWWLLPLILSNSGGRRGGGWGGGGGGFGGGFGGGGGSFGGGGSSGSW